MMTYLAMNIALALSYGLYRVAGARRLDLAKGVLVSALTLGAAYPLIPGRRLRALRVPIPQGEVRYDARDGDPEMRERIHVGIVQAATPAPTPPADGHLWWWWLIAIIPLAQLWRVMRILRNAIVVRRIGRVRIAVAEVTIPFSFIGRRAHVVVPRALDPRYFNLAIRHELQHHRQGDTRWIYLLEATKLAFFANPAAYAWAAEIVTLQEFACDTALVRGRVSPAEYGRCLLAVAESSQSYAFTAGMAATQLRRRIEMLAYPKRPRPIRFAAALIAVSSLTVAAFASANLAKPADHPPKVDARIQAIVDGALRDGVAKAKARAGYAIVQDVKSGQVLAVGAIGKEATVANFLSAPTEPWSVMKPILASAAVDEKRTRWDETHDCEKGKFVLDGKVYQDWKPFDKLTTTEMVTYSSDICAIKVMLRADREQLLADLRKLGFGEGSLASEYPQGGGGTLPHPTSEGFAPILTGGAVGLLVTPIEIAGAYVAMANGGKLLTPREYDADDTKPQLARETIGAEVARGAREAMRKVVLDGTGHQAQSALYTTGGKTGTGRKWVGGTERQIAAFAGMAPLTDPRVVVYVTVLDPAGGQAHGAEHAAPVFRVIAEKSLQALGVAPDRGR